MPIIQIHLMEGRSEADKHLMMKRVTEAVVESLHVKPTAVRIIVQEIQSGAYSVAGEPMFAQQKDAHLSVTENTKKLNDTMPEPTGSVRSG